MWLIIDDIRELGCDIIARTAEAGRAVLTALPRQIDCLCLDHDLGATGPETGLDVLRWAIRANVLPDHVQLVTSNPVGRANMIAELIAAGYTTRNGGTDWEKGGA